MAGPAILFAGPLLAAIVVYALRRWPPVATAVALAATVILFILLAVLGPAAGDQSIPTWTVFSRPLALTGLVKASLLFTFGGLALLLGLSFLLPQGTDFAALSLALLSPLAVALMIEPLIIGAGLLLVVFGALALLIQDGRAGSALGALRTLTLGALAVPLLLVASWMLEAAPDAYLDTATGMLLLAIVILLAGFPFHIWVGPVVTEARALVPAVAYGLVPFVMVVFYLKLLDSAPVIRASDQFSQLLQISGLVTVIAAGLLSPIARTFGRLLGYLLLFDIGMAVLSLTQNTPTGLETTVALLVSRVASLVLAGFGLGLMRRQAAGVPDEPSTFAANTGLAWHSPLGVALFALGCLSLAGLPLTPAFRSHWEVISLVGRDSPALAALVVLPLAGAVVALLRAFAPLLRGPEPGAGPRAPETPVMQAVAGLVLAAGLLLALAPQLLLSLSRTIAGLF